MKGDAVRAARYAQRKSALASPLGHVARIIVAKQSGDEAGTSAAWLDLRTQFPAFAADIPASLARHAMVPQLRERLVADLGVAL